MGKQKRSGDALSSPPRRSGRVRCRVSSVQHLRNRGAAGAESLPTAAAKTKVHTILCGPMIPVVTHNNRDLSLDLPALRANVQYLIEHGIRNGSGCLLIGGAGGDAPMLSVSERTTLARTVAEIAAGRVPFVLGAQATDERVTLEMARAAA